MEGNETELTEETRDTEKQRHRRISRVKQDFSCVRNAFELSTSSTSSSATSLPANSMEQQKEEDKVVVSKMNTEGDAKSVRKSRYFKSIREKYEAKTQVARQKDSEKEALLKKFNQYDLEQTKRTDFSALRTKFAQMEVVKSMKSEVAEKNEQPGSQARSHASGLETSAGVAQVSLCLAQLSDQSVSLHKKSAVESASVAELSLLPEPRSEKHCHNGEIIEEGVSRQTQETNEAVEPETTKLSIAEDVPHDAERIESDTATASSLSLDGTDCPAASVEVHVSLEPLKTDFLESSIGTEHHRCQEKSETSAGEDLSASFNQEQETRVRTSSQSPKAPTEVNDTDNLNRAVDLAIPASTTLFSSPDKAVSCMSESASLPPAPQSSYGAVEASDTSKGWVPSLGSTSRTLKRPRNWDPAFRLVTALYDFEPSEAAELKFAENDLILCLRRLDENWSEGVNITAKTEGILPMNFVSADESRRFRSCYSFQASIEEDMSFEENEELWLIETIDENWAQGVKKVDQHGVVFGVFPLNYVEQAPLIE